MEASSPRAILVGVLSQNRTSIVGILLAAFIIVLAIMAPVISGNPVEQHISIQYQPPSRHHVFGTDEYGRDVFSRVIWGARISLLVGVLSVLMSLVLGVALGIIGGYKEGLIDQIILRYIDIFMSLPMLVMGLVVLAIMGSGISRIIIAITIAMTPRVARLARASSLSVKQAEFIKAARAIGQNDMKIIIFHILPNIMGDVIVMGALWMANAILVESSLSFVGLGVSPPTPSWGAIIREGMSQVTNAPHISLFPGLAILVTVFAFNLIADGLRDIADPKLRA
jgi:peptide/nickel transport system permease protein